MKIMWQLYIIIGIFIGWFARDLGVIAFNRFLKKEIKLDENCTKDEVEE